MAVARTTLLTKIRPLLNDNPFETTHSNALSASSADKSVNVPDGTQFAVGQIIEWFEDGEQALIEAIAANVLTVKRGHRGTTVTAHAADSVIVLDPVFTQQQIFGSVDSVLTSLWPYVWKTGTTTITPSTSTVWYDLVSDVIDLVQVHQLYGTSDTELVFYGRNELPIELRRDLPSALVASGIGLRFPNGFADLDHSVTVSYRTKISATVSSDSYTDLEDGMMTEMVVYGTCARLLSAAEIPRATQEDVSMGDATIQPGTRLALATWYETKFRELRNQYHDELTRLYPPMQKWGR